MDRVTGYRIPASAATVRAAAGDATLPSALLEPLQALVTAVTRRAAEGPFSIYVCAGDDDAQARDDVAFLLARALQPHVPSALLVDCDFASVGLHGLVPQRDALGFLDFLLYGSSIGVITQESRGVRVVSAGSFPVSRRMPFVETAFSDAARRLAAHARVVLFVGPLMDDEGKPHPLAGEADVVALVSPPGRGPDPGLVDRVGDGGNVWTIELGGDEPARPARVEETRRPAHATGVPPAVTVDRPRSPEAPVAAAAGPEPRYSSLAPRIAIIVFGIFVIAFTGWWFMQGRNARELTGEPVVRSGPPDTVAAVTGQPADTTVPAPAETALVVLPVVPRDTVRVGAPAPPDDADTGGRTGGTQLISPADIHVMADMEARWRDWFVIHISSFQESIRAREEVAFLQSREFPVFIVYLDLGPKGRWYRVYAGPFRTREEARVVKKNLDAIPQVRFTRITKIPE